MLSLKNLKRKSVRTALLPSIFLFLIKKIKISVWILFLSMSYIQYVPKVERITFTFVQNSSLCLCIQILQSEKVQSIVYQR